MKYIVDIDGTICSQSGTNYHEAKPLDHRIKFLNSLLDKGNEIVYFTARGMGNLDGNIHAVYKEYYQMTKNQLDNWGVKYTDIILGKPPGDVYIDDRAIKDKDFFNIQDLNR